MKAVLFCAVLLGCVAATYATNLPCTEVRYIWKDCPTKTIRRVEECYCLVLTDDESDGCGDVSPCDGSTGDQTSGNLTFYYTRYDTTAADPFNVKSVDVQFGPTSFSISNKMKIAKVAGADGITGNPANDHEVIVGGHESGKLIRVDVTTGVVTNYQSNSAIFHIEVANPTTIFSGISEDPTAGSPQIFKLNAAGVIVSSELMDFTADSDDTKLTQVITTPYGYFYTAGNFWEAANFGRLTQVGTKWKTEILSSRINAAHGASYDPWTNSIIMGGTQQLAQFRLASYTWKFLNVASLVTQLDQLILDGFGHVWVADNGGKLLYVNYRDSKDISNPTYRSAVFLDTNLDDIAPLIGHGGVCDTAKPTGIVAP